jgi:hypothetical protein
LAYDGNRQDADALVRGLVRRPRVGFDVKDSPGGYVVEVGSADGVVTLIPRRMC